MNAVGLLMTNYNLIDPVGSDAIGVFTDTTLQKLYNRLVAQGNTSQSEAFKVGATIEDLDIQDLKIALASIDNQDIRLV